MTNTELGDLVEAALARVLGWKPLVGHGAGTVRQGAFDMIDERGVYVEVKACSVYAKEYKVKTGAHAQIAKMEKAAELGLQMGTVIVVVKRTSKGLKGSVYRRDSLGNFRLGDDGSAWEFVGKVKI
jgi:hypothetical protein